MGLITVKALRPAAGEQFKFGSEYALTLSDMGFNDGGVLQLFSINQTNASDVVMAADTLHVLQSVALTNNPDLTFASGAEEMVMGSLTTALSDLSFQGS